MKIKEVVKQLCMANGVSGAEDSAAEVAVRFLREYTDDIKIDPLGNVIARIKEAAPGKPTLLLDAHIDQIGMIVTYVEEGGFLKVGNCGGIDRRLLLGQQVTVLGKEPVRGIIASKPPHLQDAEESKKTPEIDAICIDTGYTLEELNEKVALGDRVVFHGEFLELENDRVSAPALDDRAGVASILQALDYLKETNYDCGLVVAFSVQEELGCVGAVTSAFSTAPDLAIAIDVSFAYTSDAEEHKCGKMGEGTMIGIAPILNREVTDTLFALAKEQKIPYQTEVMSGTTGTNADKISISRSGVRTGLLSIPQKYMHTPIEVIEWSDLDSTARLLAAFVKKAGDLHG